MYKLSNFYCESYNTITIKMIILNTNFQSLRQLKSLGNDLSLIYEIILYLV